MQAEPVEPDELEPEEPVELEEEPELPAGAGAVAAALPTALAAELGVAAADFAAEMAPETLLGLQAVSVRQAASDPSPSAALV